jgi:hypothetical protein
MRVPTLAELAESMRGLRPHSDALDAHSDDCSLIDAYRMFRDLAVQQQAKSLPEAMTLVALLMEVNDQFADFMRTPKEIEDHARFVNDVLANVIAALHQHGGVAMDAAQVSWEFGRVKLP